ncbi:hypothetical protein BD311DRAFT_716083 [Dichomitus squalens]|uniref:Uncharacterized protein n=1 Tax=Dichomitus squalens TaxID=114155 RepID=A0A4Q9MWY6_9APHY|nr:hypothetical protein BD311DRAFT_716083 [Dichomitus squalens]
MAGRHCSRRKLGDFVWTSWAPSPADDGWCALFVSRVEAIVGEPTAAALAYGLDRADNRRRRDA